MLAAFMLPLGRRRWPTRLWDLIDEEDDVAVGLHLVHQALDAAFKLAPEPGCPPPVRSSPAAGLPYPAAWQGPPPGRCAKPGPRPRRFLPTPGSPIRQGLSLGAAERICTTRWISFSRPMMLSSWPFRALAVKSVQKFWMCLRFFLWKLSFFCWTPAPPKPPFSPGRPPSIWSTGRGGGAAGGEQLVAAVVVVQVHQLGHLLGGRFQLLVGDAHFLHNIVDRLDPQLLGADQAEPLGVLAVHAVGDKDHGRAFLAACTKQHKRFVPFSQFNAARGGFPWKLCPMVGIGLHTGPVFYLTRQSWPECEEAVKKAEIPRGRGPRVLVTILSVCPAPFWRGSRLSKRGHTYCRPSGGFLRKSGRTSRRSKSSWPP